MLDGFVVLIMLADFVVLICYGASPSLSVFARVLLSLLCCVLSCCRVRGLSAVCAGLVLPARTAWSTARFGVALS